MLNIGLALREKCPYLEFFWSIFPRSWTKYGEIRSISLYSVRMQKNTDQENSEYGNFSGSVGHVHCLKMQLKITKSEKTAFFENEKCSFRFSDVRLG